MNSEAFFFTVGLRFKVVTLQLFFCCFCYHGHSMNLIRALKKIEKYAEVIQTFSLNCSESKMSLCRQIH